MKTVNNYKIHQDQAWKQIVFQCCMSEITIYLEKVEEFLKKGDFKSVIKYIADLHLPRDHAARLSSTPTEKQQLADINRMIDVETSKAEGMKKLHLAEITLSGDRDPVDRALIVLDTLSEVKQLTRDCHTKTFLTAKLLEGKIFLNDIVVKSKANLCSSEILNHPLAKDHIKIYTAAKFFYEQLELEESRKLTDDEIQEKSEENKSSMLLQLQNELLQLKNADETMDDFNLVDFSSSNFPPTHQQNSKKNTHKEKETNSGSGQSLLDKIHSSVHGEKYKLLCEEIAKRVNSRLEVTDPVLIPGCALFTLFYLSTNYPRYVSVKGHHLSNDR